jgi:diguanylate cyclase (GGDEF)-like protein
LLHPAVVTLFHYLPESSESVSPSLTYEKHLGKLLNVLMDYKSLPPELELLGEAIGQLWKKSAENATHAFTDLLTGTLNRRGLSVAMKPLAYLARREKKCVGVLILEVTNLKEVNRVLGRRAGDELLAAVGRAISTRLRSSDVIGRFGGDDFLALLTRFEPPHFELICEELLTLAGEVPLQGVQPQITLGSAWGTIEDDVVRRVEGLVRAADAALITAREGGVRLLVRKIGVV